MVKAEAPRPRKAEQTEEEEDNVLAGKQEAESGTGRVGSRRSVRRIST